MGGVPNVPFTTNQSSGSDDVQEKLVAMMSEGEIDADTDEVDTDEVDTDEVDTDEVDTDEVDTDEVDTDEVDPDDVDPDDVDPDEVDPDDGPALEVSDFAQLLKVDENALIVEEDGTVSFRTKVDGEVGKVSLDDLIKSHQTDAHVTKKSQALAEEKRTFEAQAAQQVEVIKSRLNEVTTVSKMLETQLTSEFNSINWDQLRIDSPAEWTAKRQEFTDRVNALNAAKQQAAEVLRQQAGDIQARADSERTERLTSEAELLRAALPEWNDPEAAQKGKESMSKFLIDTYGFDENDINGVESHRLILLALDAQKYRQGQKLAKVAKKKLKKLPKLTKPGRKGNRPLAVRTQAQQKARARLRKTGSVKDTANALMDIIS